jgi:uncharacterized damage-inducible protein DinB
MYTIEHLRGLFEYNHWANMRLAESLRTGPPGRTQRILAHLLTTEAEYYERLFGSDSAGFDFWPALDINACAELARETNKKFLALLRGSDETGLDTRARYKTSAGVSQENSFREMLTHVLLHSSTHRGNIMLKLREDGFEPPAIDYIIYLREGRSPEPSPNP